MYLDTPICIKLITFSDLSNLDNFNQLINFSLFFRKVQIEKCVANSCLKKLE